MVPTIINLPKIIDKRGNLSFFEHPRQLPFEIARTYWIYDVPGGESRGSHAFKEQQEFISYEANRQTILKRIEITKGEIESKHKEIADIKKTMTLNIKKQLKIHLTANSICFGQMEKLR